MLRVVLSLLVSGCIEEVIPPYTIIFLDGMGDGTFHERSRVDAEQIYAIAVRNQEGQPSELAVLSAGTVTVFQPGGGGGPRSEFSFTSQIPSEPSALAAQRCGVSDALAFAVTLRGGELVLISDTGQTRDIAAEYDLRLSEPAAVVCGDFDIDGITDLAVADLVAGTVITLKGDAAGGYETRTYATAAMPASISIADFNRDGISDLSLAHMDSDAGGVSILLGEADATFQSPRRFGRGLASSISSADLNLDGASDVILCGADVITFHGDGSGGFSEINNIVPGLGASDCIVSDFDTNGTPDIALIHPAIGLTVLMNTKIALEALPSLAFQQRPRWVKSGEFSGDAVPDLVVVTSRD
jgi:hypothetical protein